MIMLKGAAHIRTMHQLKSFRALPNSTGWPLSFIEGQRMLREAVGLMERQMRHCCLVSCWKRQQEKIRQRFHQLP